MREFFRTYRSYRRRADFIIAFPLLVPAVSALPLNGPHMLIAMFAVVGVWVALEMSLLLRALVGHRRFVGYQRSRPAAA